MQVKNVANASAKHVRGGYAAVSSSVRYAHLSSGVWVSGCAAGLPEWGETTEDTEGHRKSTAYEGLPAWILTLRTLGDASSFS